MQTRVVIFLPFMHTRSLLCLCCLMFQCNIAWPKPMPSTKGITQGWSCFLGFQPASSIAFTGNWLYLAMQLHFAGCVGTWHHARLRDWLEEDNTFKNGAKTAKWRCEVGGGVGETSSRSTGSISSAPSLLKTHSSTSFTFKSSRLGGRGPGFLLEIVLFCLWVLAAVDNVLLFKIVSCPFPQVLWLSLTGL